MSDPQAHTQTFIVDERIAAVRKAIIDGTITPAEGDAYLLATCGMSLAQVMPELKNTSGEQDPTVSSSKENIFALVIFALFAIGLSVLIWNSNIPSLTGLAVFEVNQTGITNETIPVSGVFSGINVTGTLIGEGSATLTIVTPDATYIVGVVSSDSGEPITDRPSYAVDDVVDIMHAPAQYSAYFDDGAHSASVTLPMHAWTNGTLLIVANESSGLQTYRLPIIIGDAQRNTPFSLCGEACAIPATTGELRIIATGTTVTLDSIETLAENTPPYLAVEFANVTVDGETTLDLGGHFIDDDGDALLFSTGTSELVNAVVDGSTLRLSAAAAGEGTLTIYASDLHELVPATVHITVLGNGMVNNESATTNNESTNITTVAQNETNTTSIDVVLNETLPGETNETALNGTLDNETINATVELLQVGLDCSNPNPNLRPIECLQAQPSEYFPEEDIYWTNLDRVPVAKLNVVGNLLILGTIEEHATGYPGPRDFTIGLPDRDGNIAVSAWIDNERGDLHIRGTLIEEQSMMQPPPGSFSVLTRRSIYLAYVDHDTGNLYLRGNVIPYRRAIE